MKAAEVFSSADIRQGLEQDGFARIEARQMHTNYVFDEAFKRLRRVASLMPVDHTDAGAGRSRLYGKMVHHAWLGATLPVPPRRYEHSGEYGIEYTQPASLNSEAGGVRRVFAPVPPSVYKNLALQALATMFRNALPLDSDVRAESTQIGIHLIKLEASAGVSAKASPNHVHRDGEPFTVAVLLDRFGAEGGENAITRPQWHNHEIDEVPADAFLARFTLERPLDAYVVRDDRVAHYVAPVVCGPAAATGVRTVLLMDFTPLRPAIVQPGALAS